MAFLNQILQDIPGAWIQTSQRNTGVKCNGQTHRVRKYWLLATPPLTTRLRTGISFLIQYSRASFTLSSSCCTAAVWKARAIAFFIGMSNLFGPSRLLIYCLRLSGRSIPSVPSRRPAVNSFMCECSAANANWSFPGIGRGNGGMAGVTISGSSAQNFSRASPGPRLVHLSSNSLETLSNVRPMLSSCVVARILKDVDEVASRSRECPPETSRVKKGYCGTSGQDVKSGVNACPC